MRDAFRFVALPLLCLSTAGRCHATFTPGDVFAADGVINPNLFNITAGGDYTLAAPFATLPGSQSGQLVWAPDLSVAFATVWGSSRVVAISPAGEVTSFATGLSGPTGIAFTPDGRLMVCESNPGEITDITAGGDFIGVTPFATGLSVPLGLEVYNGQLLVAEQMPGEISNVTGGGVIGPSHVYAFGLTNPRDMEVGADGLYVTEPQAMQVTRITTPGNYSAAEPFATGRYFTALAFDGGG